MRIDRAHTPARRPANVGLSHQVGGNSRDCYRRPGQVIGYLRLLDEGKVLSANCWPIDPRGRFRDRLSVRRGRQAGDVAGGEVGAGTVPACGMSPPAGGVAGDVDADFHHQLGFHQRDVELLLAAPPDRERPACPRMTAPPRSEQTGDRRTCRLGEGGGAADVLKAACVVVPAGPPPILTLTTRPNSPSLTTRQTARPRSAPRWAEVGAGRRPVKRRAVAR